MRKKPTLAPGASDLLALRQVSCGLLELLDEWCVAKVCVSISTKCPRFAVLPIWEYLITMDREIDLVWKSRHRFSLVSTLLVSTRVNMVLYALLQIVAYVPEGSCAVSFGNRTGIALQPTEIYLGVSERLQLHE